MVNDRSNLYPRAIMTPEDSPPPAFGQDYWGRILTETRRGAPIAVWRAYMQQVYRSLIQMWLPAVNPGRGLKTDLFEEAVTEHHLLPELGPRSVGIDGSVAVVQAARHRLGESQGLFVVGDLRRLPLQSEVIHHILSGSSLDHFSDKVDIATALAELARVLVPGGTLVITFDNPHNPVVWLRNRLPFTWLHRLRLVPYYVGATYDRAEARGQLEAIGLTVTHLTAVAHAPRAPAIWATAVIERLKWDWLQALVGRVLSECERLERWPTRYWTGYYIALRAEKPKQGSGIRPQGSASSHLTPDP
jgi:SAM-dependent methyltransferase